MMIVGAFVAPSLVGGVVVGGVEGVGTGATTVHAAGDVVGAKLSCTQGGSGPDFGVSRGP